MSYFYSTLLFIMAFTKALDFTLSLGGSMSFYLCVSVAQIRVPLFELPDQTSV